MTDSEYVPQHMEDEPKHARNQENMIAVFQSGRDFADPDGVIGRAWAHAGNPDLYYMEINPESDFAKFVSLGTIKAFTLSAVVADIPEEDAQVFWKRQASGEEPS